jgi:UDP-N-acetylmuramoyl-tripeptide--D-alanyl-D-alanine ligase
MESRSLDYIADACSGRLPHGFGDRAVRRLCSDSRQAREGDLFLAIPGERFDGHRFLDQVVAQGVAAVLVQRGRWEGRVPATCPVVEVEDTRRALGSFAARYRKDFDIAAVAVAGSNGKTTTKELVASVLRQRLSTVWSEASFNNDIGVPFTLLRLEASHQAGVFELGTNHPGELRPLIEMVRPRIGIITSIGREHLEFFKDLAGVAEEEGTLAAMLPPEGVLLLNGDSEWSEPLARRARCRVVRVGLGEANDWRAGAVQVSSQGTRFEVSRAPEGHAGPYALSVLGRHQVTNALLAAAAGQELGLDPGSIRKGLIEARPAKSRLVLTEHRGMWILDDSYNANADSMLAALQTLRDLPCEGRRIAVVGDMAELGQDTTSAHEEVGRAAASPDIHWLVAVGGHAAITVGAARRAGLDRVDDCGSADDAIRLLRPAVRAGDVVLVKASRAAGLDRVSEALRSAGL